MSECGPAIQHLVPLNLTTIVSLLSRDKCGILREMPQEARPPPLGEELTQRIAESIGNVGLPRQVCPLAGRRRTRIVKQR